MGFLGPVLSRNLFEPRGDGKIEHFERILECFRWLNTFLSRCCNILFEDDNWVLTFTIND